MSSLIDKKDGEHDFLESDGRKPTSSDQTSGAITQVVENAGKNANKNGDGRRRCELRLIVIKLYFCCFGRRLAGQNKAFFEFPGLQRIVQLHVDLALGEQATAG